MGKKREPGFIGFKMELKIVRGHSQKIKDLAYGFSIMKMAPYTKNSHMLMVY